MTHRLHNAVYAALDEIANAEKVTRARLREMSRDLLMYVPDTDDIEIVNRLIGVLTPMNKRLAILYFKHFLPWQVEQDADENFSRFGKRMKGDKKIANRMAKIEEWLATPENNIWTWGEQNVEIKQKDFAGSIQRAIKKALEGDEKSATPPLDHNQIMAAVLEGGITLDQLLESASEIETTIAEAEETQLEAA